MSSSSSSSFHYNYTIFYKLQREISQNRSNRKRRKVEKESSAKVAKVIVKSSVGLVIRISDGKNIAGSLKGQLRELRLNNKYEAKFVKLDEEALRK